MAHYQGMTDEQLVKAYAQGSNEAFDTLLKRHQNKVFNYILRVVKNEDVANDIFQETFVKAILTIKQGRYTENGKFPAWISRIAHNLIIKCDATIVDIIIADQITNDVKALICELPELQQEVLRMRYYSNLSFKEIAEKTGVSINTALGRMRYAIINLRRIAKEKQVVLSV